ncbi:multicopper oxidase family protein [Agrobacterium sp. OT33]|uniref:multicopper oxidase family protein n=1 Tax=Agrobacterium sp. OT33 TaxID=2815338 RepID=UPI001A8FF2DA|nr:multicopper oxidase domain-containing protein [Agrobacterium sp. OT33]MBO0128475.1 multicopper oxidase domain-containing protein [Agrobacterium sp. OT33]
MKSDPLIPARVYHEFASGLKYPGFGYNGSSPGPTIRVRRGETFDKTISNELDAVTTVHWHGLVLPSDADGHPADTLAPGFEKRISFPLVQRAALNWYHPHPHESTGAQAWGGLAGFFVVEDDEEDALRLPGGDRELLLAIRDAQINASGDFFYPNVLAGSEGDFPVINGVPWPRARLGNQFYRLRILNAANARVFRLYSQAPLILIGNDGGLLDQPSELDVIEIGPAERIDVLLDLRTIKPGRTIGLDCDASGWRLLQIDIVETTRDPWQPPKQLSQITRLEHSGAPDRVFRFENDQRINGREYNMALTDFVVPFGKVERWRFESSGGAPHPIHVHGTHFQVQSRQGGRNRIMPWEKGWKDTVLMWAQESIEVLVAFDQYEGRYLLHCHKLEHEDHGMMMNFVVSRNPVEAAERAENERLFGPLCITPAA